MKQRNRAKCKLCGDIIESMHRHDMQWCKCKHIAVDGGQDYFRCIAGDWNNFLRLDEEDNEIKVEIKEQEPKPKEEPPAISKEEMVDMLKLHIQGFDNLPDHAKHQPASMYDMQCLAMIIYGILRN
jgi:hypothetical protein